MNKQMGIGALLAMLTSVAYAGPAEDAQSHFKAIAAGNVEAIMQAYGDNATLQWVGGPLNGVYVGSDKIKAVWTQFAKGNAPLEVRVARLDAGGNSAGNTVTANVEFKGKNTIKLRYVLVYRDAKLVNEVWQIDPQLALDY